MRSPLKSLFNPRSIAIVGVSQDSGKVGTVIYKNILRSGFTGFLCPINPKYSSLFGVKCFPDALSIKKPVDLGIVVIPAQYVVESVRDLAKAGVKNLIVISAGFRETGEEGKKLEKQLLDIVRENQINLIGPNCLGLLSTESDLNASFAAQYPSNGSISLLSQSGAFNTALLDLSEASGLGYHNFISLGNKSDVNENHLIEYWLEDEKTKVIGAYIEQFSDGAKLYELLRANRSKPIVLLHSGESQRGQVAAISHTGSLSGSRQAVEAVMQQSGVVKVTSIEKMLSALMVLAWSPLPAGSNVAVITNAGGPGIITTDILNEAGLSLASLSAETEKKLSKSLPTASSVHNPVDLLGDALANRYETALEITLEDPGVDALVVLLTPQLVTQVEETARIVVKASQLTQKPIVAIFTGEVLIYPGLRMLWKNKVPAYQHIEEAVHALKALCSYAVHIRDASKSDFAKPPIVKGKYVQALKAQLGGEVKGLEENLAKKIATEFKLDLPNELVTTSVVEALRFAKRVGFPIVLKATTADSAHKIEKNLVRLNITDEISLRSNFEELQTSLVLPGNKSKSPILVQEMIRADLEMLIGVNNKEVEFGPQLVLGTGGTRAELYRDIALGIMPLSEVDIMDLLGKTKASHLLNGFRGSPKLAIEEVVQCALSLQKIIYAYPQIESIDINPLMITSKRAIVADLKIFTKR